MSRLVAMLYGCSFLWHSVSARRERSLGVTRLESTASRESTLFFVCGSDVSNRISSQVGVVNNPRSLTNYIWQWGQFLDHDIDLTGGDAATNGTAPIPIHDPLDPLGPSDIPFSRSNFVAGTGASGNPRQQINEITAFIDASNVYGSDNLRATTLRTNGGTGANLATSAGDLLPFNTAGLPNAGGTGASLFLAGDVRGNEQVGLTAMHTLFVREHNRLVDLLSTQSPGDSDEELFQKARKIVGAEMQVITYEEFLPALLGPHAPSLSSYAGYDSAVNPGIANEFSTALFRFGHSLLSPTLPLVNNDSTSAGTLELKDAFFRPDFLANDPLNVDRVLMGLAVEPAQEVDVLVVDGVRNFLFGPPGAGGLDLAALNIQRGRDHGLPDYNAVRAAYGLGLITSFSQISSNADVQQALLDLYGTVNNIDAWVGALAEDHLPGASAGELITAGLVDQFERLRDGDRFFYLTDVDLTHPDIQAVIDVDDVRLADIIRWNSTMSNMQHDVFVMIPEPGSTLLWALGWLLPWASYRHWRQRGAALITRSVSGPPAFSKKSFRDQHR